MAAQLNVTNNTAESRYEGRLDADLAGIAAYEISGDVIDFNHTEVFDEFSGKGVGGDLVKAALDDVRERGQYQVKATCPFVDTFISEHEEYQDLLAK